MKKVKAKIASLSASHNSSVDSSDYITNYDQSAESPSKKTLEIVPEKPTKVLSEEELKEGLYIIESGKCEIIHRFDNFKAKELRKWDFFGECDLLKVIVRFTLDLSFRVTHTSVI